MGRLTSASDSDLKVPSSCSQGEYAAIHRAVRPPPTLLRGEKARKTASGA